MAGKVGFLLVALMWTACYVCWSEPNSQQAVPNSEHGKLTEQESTTKEPVSDNFVTKQELVDAIAGAIDTYTQKQQEKKDSPLPDNSPWWFQLLLCIFTGVLAIVGGLQAYIIFKTLKATKLAAEAARKTADYLSKIERAYLTTDSFSPKRLEANTLTEISCKLVNSGKTPAVIQQIESSIEILDKLSDPIIYKNVSTITAHIGPQARQPMSVGRIAIKPGLFEKIINGYLHIYIFVMVTYKDIFGDIHHSASQCEWIPGRGYMIPTTFAKKQGLDV